LFIPSVFRKVAPEGDLYVNFADLPSRVQSLSSRLKTPLDGYSIQDRLVYAYRLGADRNRSIVHGHNPLLARRNYSRVNYFLVYAGQSLKTPLICDSPEDLQECRQGHFDSAYVGLPTLTELEAFQEGARLSKTAVRFCKSPQ